MFLCHDKKRFTRLNSRASRFAKVFDANFHFLSFFHFSLLPSSLSKRLDKSSPLRKLQPVVCPLLELAHVFRLEFAKKSESKPVSSGKFARMWIERNVNEFIMNRRDRFKVRELRIRKSEAHRNFSPRSMDLHVGCVLSVLSGFIRLLVRV